MKMDYRKALLAGAIAALVTVPAWSAEDATPMSGKADVTTGQTTPQKAPEYSTQTPQPMHEQTGSDAQPVATQTIRALTPDDLHRQEVIGSDGEAIGRISEVVSDKQSGEIQVVISTGGFLGLIGGTEHVVPLDELRLEEKKLHINSTQEELSARTRYTEEQYVVVEPEDRPVSEFSAFEQMKPKE
jgi:sporulation protein YlmC with PRC-barrel domain